MTQYKQVKSFSFTGKLIFKEENLLKTKEGSSWRRLQFGITDGVTTQYVEVSEFGAGRELIKLQVMDLKRKSFHGQTVTIQK